MRFTSASRWSDVYLAATARATSALGDFLAATALVLALQERGAGSVAVAAVLIAAAVPPVVLARWTGRLADRVDSRLVLITAGLAQSAVCVVLAFTGSTVAIVALVAVLGCGLAVTNPTLSALVPAMVRPEDLPKASAIGQTANSIGLLLAPVLGGVLTGQFGPRVPLLLDAVCYLAIVAAGLLIHTRRGTARTADGANRPAVLRLRADTLLSSMIVFIGLVIAAVSAVNVAEVFLVRDELHGSATLYGLLGATWLGSMMIGAWVLTRRTLGDGELGIALLIMMVITCLALAACAVVPAAGWLVPLFVLGGACNGGENVAAAVLIGRRVPEELRGRAFALFGAVTNGASVIGFLLGGALLTVLPVRVVFAGAGGFALLVVAMLAVPLVRAANAARAAAGPPTPPPGSAAPSPTSPAPR